MKRWLAVLVLVLLAASAFGLDLSAGVCFDYQPLINSATLSTMKTTSAIHTLGAGAFVDATYGLLGVEYFFSFTDPKGTVYYNGVKDEVSSAYYTAVMAGTRVSYLDLTALGKYPFRLGPVTLAPALGADFLLNLAIKQNGVDLKATLTSKDKKSLSDFYLLGGVIVSFAITKSILVSVNGLFGYDLTPARAPDAMGPGYTYSGWKIKAGLSASYKIASF